MLSLLIIILIVYVIYKYPRALWALVCGSIAFMCFKVGYDLNTEGYGGEVSFFFGGIIVFILIIGVVQDINYVSEDNKDNNSNNNISYKNTNYQCYNRTSSITNKKRNYNEMTGIEFEKHCCNVLKYRGFKSIKRTPDSCDNGVDIIAYYYNNKYAIQCKRYSGKVGNKAVQEVYSGKRYYKCEYAMVISNSTYTKAAIDLAKELKVKLVTL